MKWSIRIHYAMISLCLMFAGSAALSLGWLYLLFMNGNSPNSLASHDTFDLQKSLKSDDRSPSSLLYAYSKILEKTGAAQESDTPSPERLVQSLSLQDQEKGNWKEIRLDHYAEGLKNHPNVALTVIKTDLRFLSDKKDSDLHRLYLLGLAREFGKNSAENRSLLQEIALAEIMNPSLAEMPRGEPTQKEKDNMLADRNVIIPAYFALLESLDEAADAYKTTQTILLRQTDREVRRSTVATLAWKFPELSGQIEREFPDLRPVQTGSK